VYTERERHENGEMDLSQKPQLAGWDAFAGAVAQI